MRWLPLIIHPPPELSLDSAVPFLLSFPRCPHFLCFCHASFPRSRVPAPRRSHTHIWGEEGRPDASFLPPLPLVLPLLEVALVFIASEPYPPSSFLELIDSPSSS